MSGTILYHNTPRDKLNIDLSRLDGTFHYVKHFRNALYLTFIAQNTKDGREKAQAQIEQGQALKAMKWWRSHPRYDHDQAVRECAKAKAEWNPVRDKPESARL